MSFYDMDPPPPLASNTLRRGAARGIRAAALVAAIFWLGRVVPDIHGDPRRHALAPVAAGLLLCAHLLDRDRERVREWRRPE